MTYIFIEDKKISTNKGFVDFFNLGTATFEFFDSESDKTLFDFIEWVIESRPYISSRKEKYMKDALRESYRILNKIQEYNFKLNSKIEIETF